MKLSDQRVVKELNEKVIASMKECRDSNKSWKPSWVGGKSGLAYNLFTNHIFTGGNQLVALFTGADDKWATTSALKKNKLSWRKGTKMTWVLRPVTITKDKDGNELLKPFVFFKPYPMVNGIDIVGLPEEEVKEVTLEERHHIADKLIANLGVELRETNNGKCFYDPSGDYIHMPHKHNFESVDAYYSVLFHEIGHWTGHKSRLDRLNAEKSEAENAYAFEELVAELASMYLASYVGIDFEPTEQNATYLNGWLKALENDTTFIWKASSYASKIVNYIIDAQVEVKKAA